MHFRGIFKIILPLFFIFLIYIFIQNDFNSVTPIFRSLRNSLVSSNQTFDLKNDKTDSDKLPYLAKFQFYKTKQNPYENINIAMIFTHASENSARKFGLQRCLSSMLKFSSVPLALHIITDNSSFSVLKDVIFSINETRNVKIDFEVTVYNMNILVKPLSNIIGFLQPYFSYKPGSYYNDVLFFLSVGLHFIFPYDKMIMVDIDTKFRGDIKELNMHFNKFASNSVMGIAYEQQPVYRHLLHDFRRRHSNTRAGSPPPKGIPGFNSGILLLNLKSMRSSETYSFVLNATIVDRLAKKYNFKGHLGDQDFYSLVSFEFEHLFYVLPCYWNRQLCHWWKSHGYSEVFDEYYKCDGDVKIFHGNCNSIIPDA